MDQSTTLNPVHRLPTLTTNEPSLSTPSPQQFVEPTRASGQDPADRVLNRTLSAELYFQWRTIGSPDGPKRPDWLSCLVGSDESSNPWLCEIRRDHDSQQATLDEFSSSARQTVETTRSQQATVMAAKLADRCEGQNHLNRILRSLPVRGDLTAIRTQRPHELAGSAMSLGKDLGLLGQVINQHAQRNLDLYRLDSFQRESVNYYRTRADRQRDQLTSINVGVGAQMIKVVMMLMMANPQHAALLAQVGGDSLAERSAERERLSAVAAEVNQDLEIDWNVQPDSLSSSDLALGEAEVARARSLQVQGKAWLEEGLQVQPDSRELWSSLVNQPTS